MKRYLKITFLNWRMTRGNSRSHIQSTILKMQFLVAFTRYWAASGYELHWAGHAGTGKKQRCDVLYQNTQQGKRPADNCLSYAQKHDREVPSICRTGPRGTCSGGRSNTLWIAHPGCKDLWIKHFRALFICNNFSRFWYMLNMLSSNKRDLNNFHAIDEVGDDTARFKLEIWQEKSIEEPYTSR